jgi:hypothetical protein
VYQQSLVGSNGSGISCQWSSSSSSHHQQTQEFIIKAGLHPNFLPDFEAHSLVVNRAGHSAKTDAFECRNHDDEMLVCQLVLDIQADSFDIVEESTNDPSSSQITAVSTISILTPATRLLHDANPRLSCISNGESETTIDEFAFSCPILDGLIQDVISTNQTVFGIANGTSFGPCSIQVGTDQIRTTVRL